MVGWSGYWKNSGDTFDSGILIMNNSVTGSGSTLSVGIKGRDQRLYSVTISYIVATLIDSFTRYEQFV